MKIRAFLLTCALVATSGQITRASLPADAQIDGPASAMYGAIRHHPARVVLLGDSIAWQLCGGLPVASCSAFPGAFSAGRNGENLLDQMIDIAEVMPDDRVIMSSIGGFISPGIDNGTILRRIGAAIARVLRLGGRLTVLLSPDGGFPACGQSPSAQAVANFGDAGQGSSCETMRLIRQFVVASGVATFDITGPFVDDGIHQTAAGCAALVARIVIVAETSSRDEPQASSRRGHAIGSASGFSVTPIF